MHLFDLGGDENLELGQYPFPIWTDLGESFSVSLTWNAGDESESDKRSCSFYCGACTESGHVPTQLLGFEGIGSTLLFVWVFESLLNFPPITAFSAPALPLGNKYKLASSHSLTNCHSTFHAHGSISGICPLEVSLPCWVFSFESLNLRGNRYVEICSVGIQVICRDLVPKSVQGVG